MGAQRGCEIGEAGSGRGRCMHAQQTLDSIASHLVPASEMAAAAAAVAMVAAAAACLEALPQPWKVIY